MMKVNIAEVRNGNGKDIPFRFSVGAEDIGAVLEHAELKDIVVQGSVVATGAAYRVSGRITCRKDFICDRCLTPSVVEQVCEFSEEYCETADGAEDDSINCFDGDVIDITDMIRDTLLAAQPLSNICKSDCKGLCPVCGANRNERECGCDSFVPDPRLAALQQFKNLK